MKQSNDVKETASLRKRLIKQLGLDRKDRKKAQLTDPSGNSDTISSVEMKYLKSTFDWKQEIRYILQVCLGCLIIAVAVHLYYNPLKLTLGGVSGVASIVYQLTGRGAFMSFGTMVAILNVPPLLIGLFNFGWRFVWKSVIGSVIYSGALIVTEPWMKHWFDTYINKPTMNGPADIFIFCLFGGIIFGIGIGVVLRCGFTTGGSDILGVVIHTKFPNISIGKMMLAVDATIVISTLFFYHDDPAAFLLVMYSFTAMSLSAKATDIVLEGFDHSRMAFIVTSEKQAIATAIFIELKRGATELKGIGMYSGNERPIIYCVLSSRQLPRLKRIVKEIDPKAFVAVAEAREVQGEGFETSLQEFM